MPDDLIVDRILRRHTCADSRNYRIHLRSRWRKPDMSMINKLCMEILVPILIFSVLAEKNVQLEEYVTLVSEWPALFWVAD